MRVKIDVSFPDCNADYVEVAEILAKLYNAFEDSKDSVVVEVESFPLDLPILDVPSGTPPAVLTPQRSIQ